MLEFICEDVDLASYLLEGFCSLPICFIFKKLLIVVKKHITKPTALTIFKYTV